VGYSDCNWAKDMYDRKKHYRFFHLHWRHNIHMSSKKQFIITLSTCEAEYIAATTCVCHFIS
jgi:hypothetical protein